MYSVLVIEDSPDIQDLIKQVLRPIADLTVVASMKEALGAVEKKEHDLFLLDVMLEDGDGFTLLPLLRQKPFGKETPAIFITSKGEISDKEIGFHLGAEDYIVKPFNPVELRLRVENRLKKQSVQKDTHLLVRGNLRLEIPLQKAYLIDEAKLLELTPLQFKLLFYLAKNSPEVVPRDELASMIWGDGVQVGRSIDTHINSLRTKLGVHGHYIQTVYGQGYRFTTQSV